MNYQIDKLLIPSPEIANLIILCLVFLVTAVSIKKVKTTLLDRTQTAQLRGIAIILVVVGHLWSHVSAEPLTLPLAGRAVALFLVLSGFGLTRSLHRKPLAVGEFISKRMMRVMLPYWAATFVFLALDWILLEQQYSTVGIVTTLAGINVTPVLQRIDYVRWYITLLLVWYVLFLLANRLLSKSRAVLLMFFASVVLIVLRMQGLFPLGNISHLIAFPLGCLLAHHGDAISEWTLDRRKLRWLVAILFVASGAAIIFVGFITPASGGSIWFLRLFVGNLDGIVFSAFLIFAVGLLGHCGIVSRFLAFTGDISYELFLIHGPLLIKYNPILILLPAGLVSLSFCGWLASVMAISWLLHRALTLLSRRCLQKMSSAGLAYVTGIHFILLLMFLKPGLSGHVLWMLGLRDQPPGLARLQQNTRTFQLSVDKSVPRGAVLFFGDSHVQGLCVSAVTPRGVNFGMGGDSAVGLLHRIDDYSSLRKAGAVVLWIGVRDVSVMEGPQVVRNIRAIVAKVPEDTPVLISAILPVDAEINERVSNRSIAITNSGIADFCASNKRCHFVDCVAAVTGPGGNLRPDYHIGDGIHLSEQGYAIWIDALRKVLRPLVRTE